jgi:CheY-like chemotaxis protein
MRSEPTSTLATLTDEPAADEPGRARRDDTGVLVIDDDVLMRLMLRAGLERGGLAVWLAAGTDEAVEVCRTHASRIAVVLLATKMAGRDGLKALDALRAVNPGVRVCFVRDASEPEPDALLRGGACLLPKPFLLSDLAATLRRVAHAAPGQA